MTWPTTRFPTSQEIADRLREFAADTRFSSIYAVHDFPETTAGGRLANFVRIGAATGTQATVVITGGVHAREWAPPTAIVNLIQALLEAFVGGTPMSMGSAVRSADDVRAIVNSVALFAAPMINPDGYDFSISGATSTDRMWRKNRRPAPGSLPSGCVAANAIGVDINRNFDVLWDFDQFYTATGIVQSSKSPCDDTFIGSAAFSEVESRNLKSLLDANEPQFFVDVHMHGRDILHSWGVEQNSPVADPTPTLNPGRVRDGTLVSGQAGFNGYVEPIGTSWLSQIVALANLMADATQAANGFRYAPTPGAALISISGASDDFSFSRNLGTTKPLIKAFTIECGTSFLPDFTSEFPQIQNEVQAALMALLRNAASLPAPTSPPSPAPSSCRC